MYRISRYGQEPIVDVDQVEALVPAIRSSEPGRYHVDEFRSAAEWSHVTPLLSGTHGFTDSHGFGLHGFRTGTIDHPI
jgi:hypothetical protein